MKIKAIPEQKNKNNQVIEWKGMIERTAKCRGQVSIGDKITDQELLIWRPVISSQFHNIGMFYPSNGLHLRRELLIPLFSAFAQPPYGHRNPISEHHFVHNPQSTLSQHIGRCSQQLVQLERKAFVYGHKPSFFSVSVTVLLFLHFGLLVLIMSIHTRKIA